MEFTYKMNSDSMSVQKNRYFIRLHNIRIKLVFFFLNTFPEYINQQTT